MTEQTYDLLVRVSDPTGPAASNSPCCAPGACADLAVLHWNEAALPLRDVNGEERPGGCWEPVAAIRGGQVV